MDGTRRTRISQKITLIGAVVNFFLAIFKIIVGVIGHSHALVADGIHSFSDLASDAMIYYATTRAQDAPDAEHPYGHERFETIATLGLGVMLALVGGGVIIDAARHIFNPEPFAHGGWLLAAALASIVGKEALFQITKKIGTKIDSPMLVANAWHHRSDALSSVVVLAGIIGALNDYPYFDGVAALIVGLMIIYMAWQLGAPAVRELVDTALDPEDVERLHRTLQALADVENIHTLRTRRNGRKITCDVHVQVSPFLSVSEGHMVSLMVEETAKKCFDHPMDVTVHIDPEDDEADNPYAALPERQSALSILKKALADNDFQTQIKHIRLHYLGGKIHVDFYLPLDDFENQKSRLEIACALEEAVAKLPHFGVVKIYYQSR